MRRQVRQEIPRFFFFNLHPFHKHTSYHVEKLELDLQRFLEVQRYVSPLVLGHP